MLHGFHLKNGSQLFEDKQNLTRAIEDEDLLYPRRARRDIFGDNNYLHLSFKTTLSLLTLIPFTNKKYKSKIFIHRNVACD